jgi:hypothetical protein
VWGYGNFVYSGRRPDDGGFVAQPRALRAMATATTLLGVAAIVIAVLT